ncbi:hypothetical protein CJ030_MR8G004046 [Morella rubra]|uniref:F-box domain-containing protein n=1 Tax=Morella rubra TaxID=262757 RepID=A0A6A1UUQ8_9ROSI|nr:hypothetical protein CJ030_MR8G004046 [Morella rubra]
MEFSEEIILYIFSWLPAKSICRFKTVCKSFFEFSAETFFAFKQTRNLQLKDDSLFFIQPDSCRRYSDRLELHALPGEELSSGVPYRSLQFLMNTSRILASSNGLVLCRNTRTGFSDLFLCNPATQTWLSIPTAESLQIADVVFECNNDELDSMLCPDDYILMAIEGPKDWLPYRGCKVYSSKEGIWREKENIYIGGRNIRFEMPVFHYGVIYFISDCFPYVRKTSLYYRPYIVAWDVRNGVSRMLRVPKEARRGSDDQSCIMGIFKWGTVTSSFKSICLIRLRKSKFTAWVLTDYYQCLWSRILKIRVRAMGLREQNPIVAGFTVLNGDSLVFATEEKVYRYCLEGEECCRIEEVCLNSCGRNVCFHSYSNTLRPCGKNALPFPT